jgi:1,4-alpha-glucan branching enzyme
MVGVAGSFNDWNPQASPLEHTADGEWSIRLMLRSGQYEYRFVADGVWDDDHQAVQRVANPYGGFNSVLNVRLDDRTDLL